MDNMVELEFKIQLYAKGTKVYIPAIDTENTKCEHCGNTIFSTVWRPDTIEGEVVDYHYTITENNQNIMNIVKTAEFGSEWNFPVEKIFTDKEQADKKSQEMADLENEREKMNIIV